MCLLGQAAAVWIFRNVKSVNTVAKPPFHAGAILICGGSENCRLLLFAWKALTHCRRPDWMRLPFRLLK